MEAIVLSLFVWTVSDNTDEELDLKRPISNLTLSVNFRILNLDH